ncbi:hypothetical protein M783_04935 [Neisseria gonorrhoeae MU_NG18]|nr:hypothetical protein M783_04935 [Neisseria gonorrhoeae MU_NG18]
MQAVFQKHPLKQKQAAQAAGKAAAHQACPRFPRKP